MAPLFSFECMVLDTYDDVIFCICHGQDGKIEFNEIWSHLFPDPSILVEGTCFMWHVYDEHNEYHLF